MTALEILDAIGEEQNEVSALSEQFDEAKKIARAFNVFNEKRRYSCEETLSPDPTLLMPL